MWNKTEVVRKMDIHINTHFLRSTACALWFGMGLQQHTFEGYVTAAASLMFWIALKIEDRERWKEHAKAYEEFKKNNDITTGEQKG